MNPQLTAADCLLWTARILSLALIQQSFEFFQLRKQFSQSGTWSWKTLSHEFKVFSLFFQKGLGFLLSDANFFRLIVLNFLIALISLFFPHFSLFLTLLLIDILICLRWVGTFNGGSDFMTLIVIYSVCFASAFSTYSSLVRFALGYIAVQSISSYFIAGVTKLRKKSWRTGEALQVFVNSSIYGTPVILAPFLSRKSVLFCLSWGVLLFECTFPLVVFSPRFCGFYLALAFTFHVINAFVFGLNRFVLAWGATYPAIYYLSQFHLFAF